MNIGGKLLRTYFNYGYNPLYDFTTGRLNRYYELQRRCVRRLELKDNDRVLCVGVGTGNEVVHILQTNGNVSVVGVDYSHTALKKAYRKALAFGKEIDLVVMDARVLQFPTESFDKVLCIHLMDFVGENETVTSEIFRVLKHGGRFIITYPSTKESASLGLNLLKGGMRQDADSGSDRIRSFLQSLTQMVAWIVYLPILFRPNRKSYSRRELQRMIAQLMAGPFEMEEDTVYQDFIICGRKSFVGGKQNDS